MRILFVSATFPPKAYGGITSVSYNLARALTRRGHQVSVYTTDFRDRSKRISRESYVDDIGSLDVQYFRNLSNVLAYYRLFLPPRLATAIRRNIRSYDVVHLHDFRSLLSVAVHSPALSYEIPYVLQAHGTAQTLFQKGSLKRAFDDLWGKALLRDAARLIATTPDEASQYRRLGAEPRRIVVVPNGLDIAEYSSLPRRGSFRRKLGIADSSKLVLFVGRIHRTKGVDLLVRAFRELLTKGGDVRLAIVGPDDGDLKYVLRLARELGVADRMFFSKGLYSKEKLEAFVDADLLVLPSRYEIFGLVVLESIMCGTPVIVSAACGTAALIRDLQIGKVVPSGDVMELARAMESAIASPTKGSGQVALGRRYISENLGWSTLAAKMEAVYSEACGGD